MTIWLVIAAVVGGGMAAVFHLADRARGHQPEPSRDERLRQNLRTVGLQAAVEHEAAIEAEKVQPLRAEAERCARQEERWQARRVRLVDPVLGDGVSVVHGATVILVSALAVFFFVANRELDIGLLLTHQVSRAQAVVVGTIIATFTALLGIFIVELLFPSIAFPKLKAKPMRTRLAWAIPLVIVFLATIAQLPDLASDRAEKLMGGEVDRAVASCAGARADVGADPAEVELACATADRLQTELSRARSWDQLVAVAAPVGEAATSWAVLRLLELAAALAVGRAAQRASERRAAADDRVRRHELRFNRRLSDAVTRVNREDGGPTITAAEVDGLADRHRATPTDEDGPDAEPSPRRERLVADEVFDPPRGGAYDPPPYSPPHVPTPPRFTQPDHGWSPADAFLDLPQLPPARPREQEPGADPFSVF